MLNSRACDNCWSDVEVQVGASTRELTDVRIIVFLSLLLLFPQMVAVGYVPSPRSGISC